MAPTLAIFESHWFLPVGTPKSPCIYSSCWQGRCTVDACQTILNYPGIFERMKQSLMRPVEVCMKSHGGYFKYLFVKIYSFNYNSQIKYFRAHVLTDNFLYFLMWNWFRMLDRLFSYTLHISYNKRYNWLYYGWMHPVASFIFILRTYNSVFYLNWFMHPVAIVYII
jgi:hypothetical protein